MRQQMPAHRFTQGQFITDPTALVTFEVDAGFDRGKPDAVFFPTSTADVSRLLQWAHTAQVPIVARGAGTGLSGGAVAEQGGIIVEFARMNRILALDPLGRTATVEPGVVNLKLDGAAKEIGLYFPPDPSSGRSAVLGGNVAENSGGPHCFKYGVTTNYVTGLEVVLADGAVVRTGGRALDYPELDLTGLLVGSEGTLGLITRIETRLLRNPPAVKTLMVSFHSIAQAGAAVSAIIAAGLVPATLEMMDRKVMGMIEAYVQVGLPVTAEAALIVEVDGYAGQPGQPNRGDRGHPGCPRRLRPAHRPERGRAPANLVWPQERGWRLCPPGAGLLPGGCDRAALLPGGDAGGDRPDPGAAGFADGPRLSCRRRQPASLHPHRPQRPGSCRAPSRLARRL